VPYCPCAWFARCVGSDMIDVYMWMHMPLAVLFNMVNVTYECELCVYIFNSLCLLAGYRVIAMRIQLYVGACFNRVLSSLCVYC
jgi:hypothetical protein